MPKGGWIVKLNEFETVLCHTISFDYDRWEYTVNNKETKRFPDTGISKITIEIGED